MNKESIKQELTYAGSHGEAINKACEHLPELYSINIVLEKNGYGVYLTDQSGDTVSIDGGGEGIISEILEAIRIANGVD